MFIQFDKNGRFLSAKMNFKKKTKHVLEVGGFFCFVVIHKCVLGEPSRSANRDARSSDDDMDVSDGDSNDVSTPAGCARFASGAGRR